MTKETKTCVVCKNPWNGEKNGKKTGMKSNTVLKGVENKKNHE